MKRISAIMVLTIWALLCAVFVMQKAGYLLSPPDNDYAVGKICAAFGNISHEKPVLVNVPVIADVIFSDDQISESSHQQDFLNITMVKPLLPPLPATPLRI